MKNQCQNCAVEIVRGYDNCESCCDHYFDADEGFMCLECGKDGTEEIMSRAHDRAKDLRKYGHE